MAILITGANRGIGKGLRDHYVAEGETVYGTARGELPVEGNWLRLDLRDPAGFPRLAERLDSVPLDLLVCNAGVYRDKGMKLATEYPAALWAETFAVNVTGVFLTVQALLPNLQMADAPRVAVITSAMGSSERAPGHSYAYRASKAAATNLARNLAVDLEPIGIAVGAYHPGWVRTDMGGSNADIGLADCVAGLAARFGALDLASTGEVLSHDGSPVPF
ncbi:SDR family NAD(P)-dependent oxidoreductase [Mangrovicoccus sp. HB161399]|uniref:SDR family NAD(P)-dependent oxidoreductase n=1 Tax=Mangrovicoccus sp. HB161399 TaxID=2720392 RepID=UPI0015575336|nr:SDR family NAD(P)-dependent oxidoreductase [Mangrovicoccus sp. HB161399]